MQNLTGEMMVKQLTGQKFTLRERGGVRIIPGLNVQQRLAQYHRTFIGVLRTEQGHRAVFRDVAVQDIELNRCTSVVAMAQLERVADLAQEGVFEISQYGR